MYTSDDVRVSVQHPNAVDPVELGVVERATLKLARRGSRLAEAVDGEGGGAAREERDVGLERDREGVERAGEGVALLDVAVEGAGVRVGGLGFRV